MIWEGIDGNTYDDADYEERAHEVCAGRGCDECHGAGVMMYLREQDATPPDVWQMTAVSSVPFHGFLSAEELDARRLIAAAQDVVPPDLVAAHKVVLATLDQERRERQHWQEQSRNSEKARGELSNRALDFVRFVQRHTLPERAKASTHEETYSIIMHYPFAKERDPRFYTPPPQGEEKP